MVKWYFVSSGARSDPIRGYDLRAFVWHAFCSSQIHIEAGYWTVYLSKPNNYLVYWREQFPTETFWKQSSKVIAFCLVYLIPFANRIFFRLRAFFHGYNSKDSLDRCIDNICIFPPEDQLYLLTDASMAIKVDPDTLDTLDEVRITNWLAKINWGKLLSFFHSLSLAVSQLHISQYLLLPSFSQLHVFVSWIHDWLYASFKGFLEFLFDSFKIALKIS